MKRSGSQCFPVMMVFLVALNICENLKSIAYWSTYLFLTFYRFEPSDKNVFTIEF